MPPFNFRDVSPEQRKEMLAKAAETRARKKADGIPTVETDAGPKRGRPPKAKPGLTSRADIRSAIETVNALLIVGGMGKYALSEEEIVAESDALYVVCADTPGVGLILVRGRRFTAWGKLLWINYVILARRRLIPDAGGFIARSDSERRPAPASEPFTPRAAHPDTGPERIGQDDAAEGTERVSA